VGVVRRQIAEHEGERPRLLLAAADLDPGLPRAEDRLGEGLQIVHQHVGGEAQRRAGVRIDHGGRFVVERAHQAHRAGGADLGAHGDGALAPELAQLADGERRLSDLHAGELDLEAHRLAGDEAELAFGGARGAGCGGARRRGAGTRDGVGGAAAAHERAAAQGGGEGDRAPGVCEPP
jgi:hypothetical protein